MTRREDEVDNNPRNAALHRRIQTTLMRRYDTPVMNNVYRADYVECLVVFTLGTDWWLTWTCRRTVAEITHLRRMCPASSKTARHRGE